MKATTEEKVDGITDTKSGRSTTPSLPNPDSLGPGPDTRW